MASNVTIEEPTEADVEGIADLFAEDLDALKMSRPREEVVGLAREVVEDISSASPSCLCWVARLDEEVVGVILANFNLSLKFTGRSLWIEELYVTPKARRSGLGRKLVERVLAYAERHDVKGIDLEAYQGNAPASILYRTMGFHRLGRERFYYRLGEKEYV